MCRVGFTCFWPNGGGLKESGHSHAPQQPYRQQDEWGSEDDDAGLEELEDWIWYALYGYWSSIVIDAQRARQSRPAISIIWRSPQWPTGWNSILHFIRVLLASYQSSWRWRNRTDELELTSPRPCASATDKLMAYLTYNLSVRRWLKLLRVSAGTCASNYFTTNSF